MFCNYQPPCIWRASLLFRLKVFHTYLPTNIAMQKCREISVTFQLLSNATNDWFELRKTLKPSRALHLILIVLTVARVIFYKITLSVCFI